MASKLYPVEREGGGVAYKSYPVEREGGGVASKLYPVEREERWHPNYTL